MTDAAPVEWVASGDYSDILYSTSPEGIAKISINRPDVHNAFRPQTIIAVMDALTVAREAEAVGVNILTGEGGRASAQAAPSGSAATRATRPTRTPTAAPT